MPQGRWGAFLLRAPGRTVLVDTGFGRETGDYPPGGRLLACHFPAPALGRVVSAGGGRVRWEPVG